MLRLSLQINMIKFDAKIKGITVWSNKNLIKQIWQCGTTLKISCCHTKGRHHSSHAFFMYDTDVTICDQLTTQGFQKFLHLIGPKISSGCVLIVNITENWLEQRWSVINAIFPRVLALGPILHQYRDPPCTEAFENMGLILHPAYSYPREPKGFKRFRTFI